MYSSTSSKCWYRRVISAALASGTLPVTLAPGDSIDIVASFDTTTPNSIGDYLFTVDLVLAGTLIAVELYLLFRLLVWGTSWATVIMGIRRDGWARQYKAEGLPAGQTKIAQGEVV